MFHFPIRDLLWLTLFVTLGLTWYGHNQQRAKEMAKLSKQIEAQQKENQRWRNVALANEIGFKERVEYSEKLYSDEVRAKVRLQLQVKALQDELRSRDVPRTRYLLDAFELKQ